MAERVLSCFVDESGSFGPYEHHSPYYYVAMVLHDQSDDISDWITGMEDRAANSGYPNHAIHTAPLIRREGVYENELAEARKHLFNVLYYCYEATFVKGKFWQTLQPETTFSRLFLISRQHMGEALI